MKRILLLICVVLLMLTGCTTYEDTNGDNPSLQTITDENIILKDIGASGLAHTEMDLGFLHSEEYSSKNFNGVEEIFLTNYIWASEVTVYVGHMNLKSGNFKLAIVLNDEILFEVPLDAFAEFYTFENVKGTFAIRAAGESANVEFYIEVR